MAEPHGLAPSRPHAEPVDRVVEALGSDVERGLNEPEAHRRLQSHGAYSITSRGGKPAWLKFLLQFNNPLLITLLVVGSVKLALGKPRDALVIWSVTVINAVIGFVQENKAESAIAALARSVQTEVEVVREGVRRRLASQQLVPGDLVRLEAGSRVPADLRLVQSRNLHTDESVLTGESLPVGKGTTAVEVEAPLAERIGMAYAGSFVTAGQGGGGGVLWHPVMTGRLDIEQVRTELLPPAHGTLGGTRQPRAHLSDGF